MTGTPVEHFLTTLQQLNPLLILAVVFAVAFIENLFPPFPSDLIVVFAGSLVGIGDTGIVETILMATAGSTLGFVTMYKIGMWIGDRYLETGRIPFIPVTAVRKVESWFARYGYWMIVANRFLAGTRAVVSFVAGMSELDLRTTTALSFVSALIWNSILVVVGYSLGSNWRQIGTYLGAYGRVMTTIIVVIAVAWILIVLIRKRSARQEGS
jgi:membrane protein DedA with SNARE-associated domain